MSNKSKYLILQYAIAFVWIANGLFCKVMNFVPRHEEIVSVILGGDYSHMFTQLIGYSEIAMAIWILSGFYSRLNAIIQILVVATMNMLEFMLVPDLLLWGRLNAFFAFLFIVIVYYHEFKMKPTIKNPS